jgi:IS30 family transposase
MHHHFTLEERDRIAELVHRRASQVEIAEELGRSPSSISRELRRNRTGEHYHAAQAQLQAERRRSQRPVSRKMDDPQINHAVRDGLAQDWSPQQITGRLKAQASEKTVSLQTIYAGIKQHDAREHWESHLRRRGKRPPRPRKTDSSREAARVRHRPEVIEERQRLGDFEGDTVLGSLGRGGLATLVDRKSRLTIVAKIQSKDADHVHNKLMQRLKELDEDRRHSITFDNGTEFARCHRLEKHLGLKLYFADPGCPHQRGSNENTNGLIRQYFPKGTDFHTITHCQVRQVEKLLNTRPRACLGFKTPSEVFFEDPPPSHCD